MIAASSVAMPVLAPAAPLLAMLGEIGLGAGASAAAAAAREAGASDATQIGTELLASAVVPGAVTSRGPAVAKRIARHASQYDDVARLAAKHGVELSPEIFDRAASELKRRMLLDPVDPNRRIREASEVLGRDIEAFGGATGEGITPTLSQSVGELGGRNIIDLEADMARKDKDFASRTQGRVMHVQDKLDADVTAMRPQGTLGQVEAAALKRFDDMEAETQSLWRAVPKDELPLVSTGKLNETIDDIIERVGVGYEGDLPREVKLIRDAGPEATIDELIRWRSRLLRRNRQANQFGASQVLQDEAAAGAPLIHALTEEIHAVGDAGGGQLRAALASTRRNKELFDSSTNPLWRELGQKGQRDPHKIVGAINRSVDPVESARQATSMLSESEEGLTGLRAVFFDDLMDGRTPRQIQKDLSNPLRRETMTEIFGEQGMTFLDEVARRSEVVARRTGAERGAAFRTGSNVGEAAQQLSPSSSANSLLWALSKKAQTWMRDKALNNQEIAHVMLIATEDIRVAKALLDLPTPRAEAAWRIIMEQTVRNAKGKAAREAARAKLRSAPDRSEPGK